MHQLLSGTMIRSLCRQRMEDLGIELHTLNEAITSLSVLYLASEPEILRAFRARSVFPNGPLAELTFVPQADICTER